MAIEGNGDNFCRAAFNFLQYLYKMSYYVKAVER